MAASEDRLGVLHELVTESLIHKIKGIAVLDEEGKPTGEVLQPSAADLQAASKFLKDNEITSRPSDDNRMGDLKASLEERRRKRVGRVESADLDDNSFVRGLPIN